MPSSIVELARARAARLPLFCLGLGLVAIAGGFFSHETPARASAPRSAEALAACPGIGDLVAAHGERDRIWQRRYGKGLARGDPPAAVAPSDEVLRLALYQKPESDACRAMQAALVAASASALVEDSLTAGRPSLSAAQQVMLERAVRLLGGNPADCATAEACLLAARIEYASARGEPNLPAERPACADRPHAACAAMLARRAILEGGRTGPSLAGAEAWMVLAELSAEPGTLDATSVLHALDTLRLRTQLQPTSIPTGLDARIPNTFRNRELPIYQAAADAAYAMARGAGDPPELIRQLLEIGEASRRAQIESSLSDGCERLEVPLTPADLAADEQLIYPVVGAERTYILIGRNRKGAAGWRLVLAGDASGAADLAATADRLLKRLPAAAAEAETADLAPSQIEWQQSDAQHLYAQLIAPLAAAGVVDVHSARDAVVPVLVFFPDPVLRNVPWALLHPSGDPQAFLVHSAAIAVAPGLAYVRPPRAIKHRGAMFAGGFNRDGNEELEEFLDYLGQPKNIRQLSSVLVGDRFTADNLSRELSRGKFNIVLLATHAEFVRGESHIAVRAAPSATGARAEDFDVGKIETAIRKSGRRTRNLDLIILMACQGAVGDAGDLGIAGTALRAGAATMIGTLTNVEARVVRHYIARPSDEGAAFLGSYLSGVSPARALREAQLANAGQFGFPPNWGVLVVVGNWR